MDWFAEQFSQSTIISGALALGIWGAIIYLAIAQVPVPEILYFGGASVIGFFFGSKIEQRRAAAMNRTTQTARGKESGNGRH